MSPRLPIRVVRPSFSIISFAFDLSSSLFHFHILLAITLLPTSLSNCTSMYIRIFSNRMSLSRPMIVLVFNDGYCPGSAPVRCHPATGTPQWGSAEVYVFFLKAFLLSFLFFTLFVFVFAALPNLSCMAFEPQKHETVHMRK